MTRLRWQVRGAALMALISMAMAATAVQATIPAGERTALLHLYTSTNGDNWTTRTSWQGTVGTECTWAGVSCDAGQTTVTGLALQSNNLTGSLPGDLNSLPNLQVVRIYDNLLTGSIPALAGLTKLQDFEADNNQLTGNMPALAGLTDLQVFHAYNNQLSGNIPALGGLTNLQDFEVYGNQLTGSIPALAGLTNLGYFLAQRNRLSGSIPGLAGLTNLQIFFAGSNQLSGSIPALAGLTSLQAFDVDDNQLSGSIPPLTGLTNLQSFYVYGNQLSGSIPALAGLTDLQDFEVDHNQLTGSIPALADLTNLQSFYADHNQLTGGIPALAGLANLQVFDVSDNQLTGDAPSAPIPSALLAGYSGLCPNFLNHTADPAWDTATGVTPWYMNCAPSNHQGLWWAAPAASESGWGINFAHQGDTIFATWFTYGADNQPQWYTIVAHKTGTNVYAGTVSSFTGLPFNTVPYTANANVRTVVGTATINFAGDGKSATFAYTVNGIAQTKTIVPQQFAADVPLPTCVWGAQSDLTLATNYQDLWWVTDGQESGWGINFTHQGKVIFATWFTYDANGKGWWLFVVASETAVPGVYAGLLKAAVGPPFSAEPFDPNAVVRTTVGNATITFADGNHARFDYTVKGVTQTKNLMRQVFAPPGTVCR